MDNKDKFLLEQAYQQILENRYASQHPEEYDDEDEDTVKEIENSEKSKALEKSREDKENSDENEDEEEEDLVEDSYKIPHGIQPISEAKKKVNPWAVEKSIENKTGKKFGKKHKEEIIKGIKKSAKKSGKKITSEPVKSKKKVVKEGMYDPVNDITNLPAMWALASAAGVAGLVAYLKSLKQDAIETLKENPNFLKALEKLKASQEQINAAKASGDRETEVSQSKLHETIVQNLKGLLRDLPSLMRQSVVKKALKDSGI